MNKKVSELVGVKRLPFASADETAELTGMLFGGVTIADCSCILNELCDGSALRVVQCSAAVVHVHTGGGAVQREEKVREATQGVSCTSR